MADDQTMGGNLAADLKGRAEELASVLDEMDKLKDRAKQIRDDAKSEGYDLKVFNKVVKEMRAGYGYLADQLELELTLNTFRKGVGLPTDLKRAQELARQEAEQVPDSETKKARRGRPEKVN